MNVYAFMKSHRDYFEDFISRSTYHSNAIEGNTLTLAETYAILWNKNNIKVKATPRELYEAINHKMALSIAMKNRDRVLTEKLVKQIAIQINRNINEIRGYRTGTVMILGAEHVPPDARFVMQQMMELIHDYNSDIDAGRDPFKREAEFHIRFERIHPFGDGNGRTGRILIERGLMLSGQAPAVVRVDNRAEYLKYIADIDMDGLAGFLERASESEATRIERFKEIDKDDRQQESLESDIQRFNDDVPEESDDGASNLAPSPEL